jgi:hypothetical protein
MLPKPKVAFFFVFCYFAVFVCGFFPWFERDSTVYVYKRNEDEILFCINTHLRAISSSHTVLAHSQHKPGHLNDCTKGRLEKSRGPHYHPSLR